MLSVDILELITRYGLYSGLVHMLFVQIGTSKRNLKNVSPFGSQVD